MVLPLTAKTNKDGHIEIGGCDTVQLAKDFGTPLFVMDEETIRRQARRYVKAFKDLADNTEVIYAAKAFLSLAMCKIAQEEDLSLDLSSGGELYVAKKAGFPLKKTYFHGNNKTSDEIIFALDARVGRVVVDSSSELDMLNKIAGERGKKAKILLRITPGVVASTHTYLETGAEDSKFGFGLSDGIALSAVKKAISLENVELVGFHIHIGSQIFVLHSYARAVEMIMRFIREVKKVTGFEISELDTGGGLGIKYRATDQPSTIEEYAKVIISGVKKWAKELNLSMPKVMIEPGRSIVGNACVTLYTIGAIKEIPGVRTYISVDGGMSDNLRPMLYDAKYEATIANKANQRAAVRVTVAGKHCESGDVLIKEANIPRPEVGDILMTPATGAYGYVMANNYNKQPRPAVVMVEDGKAQVIIRRETYDDLVRLDKSLD